MTSLCCPKLLALSLAVPLLAGAGPASCERGRAAAVNRGIEKAETRFIAVTDDDCLVAPDWARSLVRHLRRDPGWIVTGRVDPAGDEAVLAVTTSDRPAVHRRPRLRGSPCELTSGG